MKKQKKTYQNQNSNSNWRLRKKYILISARPRRHGRWRECVPTQELEIQSVRLRLRLPIGHHPEPQSKRQQKAAPNKPEETEGKTNLPVRRASAWSGKTKRKTMACSSSFHIEGEVFSEQTAATIAWASSGLGRPSTTLRARSMATASGGSRRFSRAFAAASTRSCTSDSIWILNALQRSFWVPNEEEEEEEVDTIILYLHPYKIFNLFLYDKKRE